MNNYSEIQCFTEGKTYEAEIDTRYKGQYGCGSLNDDFRGQWGINKDTLNKHFRIIQKCDTCEHRRCNSCIKIN